MVATDLVCYHCGEACDEKIQHDEKLFCCHGCVSVYRILAENNLCNYYDLSSHAGIKLNYVSDETYAYLDEPDIQKRLLIFDFPEHQRVSFFVPTIHCVSCLWLLENCHQLHDGILHAEVNFVKKQVQLDVNPQKIKISEAARMLASLGYAPQINLSSADSSTPTKKTVVLPLAVAGFCFGNIMLFSFPDYLGLSGEDAKTFSPFFSFLNIALSIPVLLYCAKEYFRAAWRALAQRQINIDVPIALGLLALFSRSVYDILFHISPGYLDSFSGLVFFLLIGRWFQGKTYEELSFENDFTSFFPLSVLKQNAQQWVSTFVRELKVGDVIKIRNREIIPTDCRVAQASAYVDYSFLTGEAKPAFVKQGEKIFAGGRLVGMPVQAVVEKELNQSQFTQLWNEKKFTKSSESQYRKMIDRIAQKFTWSVLAFALCVAVFWFLYQPEKAWLVLTSVLIVACPCTLALAAPFTFGHFMRRFGKHGVYVKNADVIERMASINALVWDKTGTVTSTAQPIYWHGKKTEKDDAVIYTMTASSIHPMSKLIAQSLAHASELPLTDFHEHTGAGMEARWENELYKIGSATFVGVADAAPDGRVYVSVNDLVLGYFYWQTELRAHIREAIQEVPVEKMALLSGDGYADEEKMKSIFPTSSVLKFAQSPSDKQQFISDWQHSGSRVMMIGDGMNDAVALQQSDVGVAVMENQSSFTPACDVMLIGNEVARLLRWMHLSKQSIRVLKIAFGISLSYNVVSLTIAAFGYLSPLIAAILMPLSSVSVVGFTYIATWVVFKKSA